jgi:HEAT repeat protein
MIPPQVHRSCRIKRPYADIAVLCFRAVWLAPVGYGQADQVSPLIAALKDADAQVRRNAAGALGGIKDPRAVEPLLAALNKRDLAVIAGAYSFFIERAEKGSEGALIQALKAHGDAEMAAAFLNCGNSALEAAAGKWAEAHGYQARPMFGGATVHWGNRR